MNAVALASCLDAFLRTASPAARIPFDPVGLVHAYQKPRDIEVAGLLAASLAYGRADLFRPKVASLLERMGKSPARWVVDADETRAAGLLNGFVYRFNVGTDIAVLLLGMGRALRESGSLEALFVEQQQKAESLHGALSGFIAELRRVPMTKLRRVLGPERGLHHLLPSPLGPGAAKRLHMYLRWMVRGPDEVDFGIWKSVSPAWLLVPMDTHVGRISRRLGLTKRNDLSWKTAEEVTSALRRMDPADPVKYDFALCHYGMSGVCPPTPIPANCSKCLLLPACRTGKTAVARGMRPKQF